MLSLTGSVMGASVHTFTHTVSHEADYITTRGKRPHTTAHNVCSCQGNKKGNIPVRSD